MGVTNSLYFKYINSPDYTETLQLQHWDCLSEKWDQINSSTFCGYNFARLLGSLVVSNRNNVSTVVVVVVVVFS